jgi:hypothetical protein
MWIEPEPISTALNSNSGVIVECVGMEAGGLPGDADFSKLILRLMFNRSISIVYILLRVS